MKQWSKYNTYTLVDSYLVPIGQDELKFVVNWLWHDDVQRPTSTYKPQTHCKEIML